MREAFNIYMTGIERALASGTRHIATDQLTLADICFVAEVALFMREQSYREQLAALDVEPILCDRIETAYPKAIAHFEKLCQHQAFQPDVEPYLQALR